jgi:AbrB family looped-hinge helix DNA binding protein
MEEVITIDGAGRIVVPKAMRTKLNLSEGTKLRVREEGAQRLVLEPIAAEGAPVEVDGLLVIRGRLIGDVPDHREQRADRLRALARIPR